MYGISEAAKRVGVSEGLLILWISTKRIVPSVELSTAHSPIFDKYPGLKNYALDGELGGWNRFAFTDDDVEKLRHIVKRTALKRNQVESTHVAGTHYTPQELGALWGLSVDKIIQLFEDEDDVMIVGNKGNSRRRPYRTLRIPEKVAERVQRRLSNS